jgi:rod shape-determining protein MreD
MTGFSSDHLLTELPRRSRGARLRWIPLITVPLIAILFQVYIPRFIVYLGYLELPLLITVYFGLMRREVMSSLLYGAAIGLVQDSLSHQPIGMFGIVKTLVGYFSASVSQRFDVDNPFVQFLLAFFFFFFHQFLLWVLRRALLAQNVAFTWQQELVFGLLNAAVALPLYLLLDKLRE